jgi:hypothetical protein
MTTRPNLFVVGAMKSGSSTLHTYLGGHPEIFMSEPKEPCYFVDLDDLESPAREVVEGWGFWRSLDSYLALFEGAGDAKVIGESSTNYSKAPKMPGVPQRIVQFNAEARILYIMRDPVERSISHYWHAVGQRKERRDLVTAIEQERHYREVSNYAFQLEPYLRLFGAARVRALTFEALVADPSGELRRIFEWLGVDSSFELPESAVHLNPTPRELQRVRGEGRLDALRESPLWNLLGPLVPAPVRRWGRGLAAETVDRSAADTERAAEILRPYQLKETVELERLLGRSFEEWTTLYGGGRSA